MPETQVANLEALTDLCTPWCVHVAVTLKIAEHIASGHEDINRLAEAAGCDAYCLQAMLRHLVDKGLFTESDPGRFHLNEAASKLMDPAMRIGLDLEGIGNRLAHVWGTMLEYVRTGAPAYEERFGLPFWEDLDAHQNLAASFDALIGPTGHGTPNPDFDITGGWDQIHTVVDVGGGTGAMLAEVLRLHRNVSGILIDLPATVARSQEIFAAARVSQRVATSGQSFFDPLPTGGDLYLLRGIINDWPDNETTMILKRCTEAARPAGRVVILKGVSPDTSRRGLTIEMLLVGGKHRSLTEFRELAKIAGLEVSSAEKQSNGYFVVECKPVV